MHITITLPPVLATLLLLMSAGALAVPPPPPPPNHPLLPQQNLLANTNPNNNTTALPLLPTRSTSTVGWIAAYSLNDSTCTGTQIVPAIALTEKGKCYPFIPPPDSNFRIDFGAGADKFTQLDFYDAAHCDVRSRHIYVREGDPDGCDGVERYHGPFMSVVRKD